ncbi:MAG: helix-turn-helix transcriptional regulator [Spirochaetales bacterium]|jgi:transcriptional regulator with XRE-family HTH domain|nr:helix-turn-helix transcriptional regulator [Spirochaetales bacterium]
MIRNHVVFIQNLKRIRKLKNLSQAQLAELCEVSTGTIGNIECGLAKPSFDLILTMAEILKIHPAYLFATDDLLLKPLETSEEHLLLKEFYDKLKNHFVKFTEE